MRLSLTAVRGRPVMLIVACALTACAHVATEPVAVVFGEPIRYGAVEPERSRAPDGVAADARAGSPARVHAVAGGESMREHARRCGWSRGEVELRRFRHLFLSFFRRAYAKRIEAAHTATAFRRHPSRTPPRGSGASPSSFLLALDGDTVMIVPHPNAQTWAVHQALYAGHGGRVSKRHEWLPVDALRKEVERLEAIGEIRFLDRGYRRRMWRYFDTLDDRAWASADEARAYFRAPWWSTPLPASARDKRPVARQNPREPSHTPCLPP